MTDREKKQICKHCGGDIAIRNPKGFCDHLHYPENCEVCKKELDAIPTLDRLDEDRVYDITEKYKMKAGNIWEVGKSWTDLACLFDEIAEEFIKFGKDATPTSKEVEELLESSKSALGEWKLHHSLIDSRKRLEQAIESVVQAVKPKEEVGVED